MVTTPDTLPRPVLITGFDPFGGDALNPSWQLAQALHGQHIASHPVVAAQLPTVFDVSRQRLRQLLRQHRPALVICLGLASNRSALSLERVAINVNDARIPDNAGAQPIDTPVLPRGPAAYFSTLPIKAMRARISAEGVPAEISQTAGTFVCNHIFYALMHALARQPAATRARGGFIHVPPTPELSPNAQALPLPEMVRGLRAAIDCALTTKQDLALGGGQTD